MTDETKSIPKKTDGKDTITFLLEKIKAYDRRLTEMTQTCGEVRVGRFAKRIRQFNMHFLNPMSDAWRYIGNPDALFENPGKTLVSYYRAAIIMTYPRPLSALLNCDDINQARRTKWTKVHLDEAETLINQIRVAWARLQKLRKWDRISIQDADDEFKLDVLQGLDECFVGHYTNSI